MKRNNGFFILTMWWFLLTAVIGGLTFFFTSDKERISQRENRILQNRPVLTWSSFQSGEFSDQFDTFLSDSIPGRDFLIDISNKILGSFSVNTAEDLYYMDTSQKEAEDFVRSDDDSTVTGTSDKDAVTGSQTTTISDSDAARFVDDTAYFWLLKNDGTKDTVYRYPKENMMRVADNLEKYAALLPEDGNVFFVTPPPFPTLARRFSQSGGYYSGWESTLTDNMNVLTSDKIKCYNTLQILQPHILDGEDLFLYTDHQWNIHGAYYVFSEIISSQGLSPTPFDEYDYRVNKTTPDAEGHYDTFPLLYSLAPAKNMVVQQVDQKKEIPLMRYEMTSNLAFLSGNRTPWRILQTGFNTGRRALVIGDCFNLSFTPFLMPYYDEVHTTDIRYIYFRKEQLGTTLADMITRNSIDDIYIVYSEANGVDSQTLLSALDNNLN